MNEELRKKREELARNQKELEIYEHRQARLDARIRQLEKSDRAKRTHRLITRGAAVESICPEVAALYETEFFTLTEQIFSLPEVRALVSQAIGNGGDPYWRSIISMSDTSVAERALPRWPPQRTGRARR